MGRLTLGLVVMVSYAIYTNSVEYLTDKGYTASQIMVGRGVLSLIISVLIGTVLKQGVFPKEVTLQAGRFLINGASSILFISSFQFLSASTVGLISRLDIPFLIFVSFMVGQRKSQMQFWLSFWAILMIVFLALDARLIEEDPRGFALAFGAVVSVSSGFLILKKVAHENPFITSNVFSLSNIFFGLLLMLFQPDQKPMEWQHIGGFVTGAVSQVANYYFAIHLYRKYSPERARLPFILAGILIMGIEMFLEQKLFGLSQIGLTLLVTGLLATISIDAQIPSFDFSLKTRLLNRMRRFYRENDESTHTG